jgi:hypothetical protein
MLNIPLPPGISNLLAEFSLIPKEKFDFSSDIALYGDKIALSSPNESFGIIIENKKIADMLKKVFDLAWQEAKRLARKKSLYKKM